MRTCLPGYAAGLFVAFGCCAALGQGAVDGAVGGRVVDQRGDAVARARVDVASAATGIVQTASSGSDGTYLVGRLTPGSYTVTISAPGFRPSVEAITVALGAVAVADARLSIEQVVSLISVDAAPVPLEGKAKAPAQVEADPGDAGELTTQLQLEALPDDGRRWQSFAFLAADTGGGSPSDGEAAISFRGLAVTQNASQIDGASDTQAFGAVPHGTGGGAGRESEEDGDAGSDLGVGGDGARSLYGRHAGAAYTFAQVRCMSSASAPACIRRSMATRPVVL